MPTATLVRDPENGFPWGRQWDVNSGFTFIKSWMVDTDDLEACINSGWRGADGRPVQQWQYHMWVSPHPQGLFETIIELWPEYLAA